MNQSQPELRISFSLGPRYGAGHDVRFDLSHEEIDEILVANGLTKIQHDFLTDCGSTGYSRNEYRVRDADGQWHFAVSALSGILKRRLMQMLTAPE